MFFLHVIIMLDFIVGRHDCFSFFIAKGVIMKIIILLFFLVLMFTTPFSATIQEMTQDYGRRLSYFSNLDSDAIDKILSEKDFKRLFVVDDSGERYCSLLFDLEKASEVTGDIHIETYKLSDFSKSKSDTCEMAVIGYLQLQKSLFDATDIFQSFSTTKIVLDDMSYIDYFLGNLARVEKNANDYFKSKENTKNITQYIDEKHKLNVIFYNNFSNYFFSEPVDFSPTIYEEADENLPLKAYTFFDDEITNSYSQIEIFSLLALYDDYMNKVVEHAKVSSDIIPYYYLFDDEKKKNSMITAINLELLKYLASSIKKELDELNKEVSKSYGVIQIDSINNLLLLETKFEMIAYKTFEIALRNANEEGKKKMIESFINREITYSDADEYLSLVIDQLKDQIFTSCSVLSVHNNSYRLMRTLEKTRTAETKTYTPKNSIHERFDLIGLIEPLMLPDETDAHFAIIKADVDMTSDASESFTKIYPIFSSKSTKGAPMVLVDFFWVAANHVGQTLWRTLKTLVWDGFDLKHLESELSVENVDLTVERYLALQPYHDLFRMFPTYQKRLKLEIKNTNLGYLVLDNMFAGNIPTALMDSVSAISETKEYDLARYPIEVYNEVISLPSDANRKDKAIIFVHGKQNIPYFDSHYDIVPHIDAVWRNDGRLDVWNGFYEYVNKHPEAFSEYDFYEFTYDTSVYPASLYGKALSELIIRNNIHKDYSEIHMIASSMGGLVSRFCLNHEFNMTRVGDYVDQLITLDTPHLGTLAQTFILSVNKGLMEDVEGIETGTPPNINLTMGNFLYSFIDGTESAKSAELMLYFSRKHPEMVGKLFTEMLRFLDPFPGGLCMLYTPENYCRSLGVYLYSDVENKKYEEVFLSEPETLLLNKNDLYLDKLYLVSAELTAESTDITSGLSVTYELMKTAGDMISHTTMENFSRHGRNDGVVNLYSQQMWGIDEGQERKHFMNLDHLAVPRSKEVVEYLMENQILK